MDSGGAGPNRTDQSDGSDQTRRSRDEVVDSLQRAGFAAGSIRVALSSWHTTS